MNMPIKKLAAIFLTSMLLFMAACSPSPQTTTPSLATSAITKEPTATAPTGTATLPPTASPPTTAELPTPQETSAPPTLVSENAGVIRLYYYGCMVTGGDPASVSGPHNIYSATSSDGINFTEDPGVRFSYDSGAGFGITDPDVVQMNDVSWLMFISMGTSIIKATSPDSLGTFTRDSAFQWNQGGVPGSYNFDGTIRTFVNHGRDIGAAVYETASGSLQYGGIAISAPAVGSVESPSVIKIADTYYMFYHYRPNDGAMPSTHKIYMAASLDGITWSQHDVNRYICDGSVPGAVYYNGAIYVYHCGLLMVPGERVDLGVAVSLDNGVTFTEYRILIKNKVMTGVVDPAAIVVDQKLD